MEDSKNSVGNDQSFMRRAIELSHFALENNHGGPFGSVVVKEGIIVGEGWNKSKLHCDPSAHAEMEAVRDACKNLGMISLKGCTVYASAQPCPMCLSLLYLSEVDRIYFCIPSEEMKNISKGLSVEFISHALTIKQSERPIPEVQILHEEVDKLIHHYRLQGVQ